MKQKINLNEIAETAEALTIARSEPIRYDSKNMETTNFIRNLILDLPIQTQVESSDQGLFKLLR